MSLGAFEQTDPTQSKAPPTLLAATSNGNLLRFLQDLAMKGDWEFHAFLSAQSVWEGLPRHPARLLVVDVFLEDKSGFDLRGEIRLQAATQLTPILLVAPGCGSDQELSERLEVSRARFDALHVDEHQLADEIGSLMSDEESGVMRREHFRYATFLQAAGEVYHAANQPLTSLLCNLELSMHVLEDETLKQRLKISHESALKIMRIIQGFQQSKRREEKDHILPIYLLGSSASGS